MLTSTPIEGHSKRKFETMISCDNSRRRGADLPYECNYCTKKFQLIGNLQFHEQIHKYNNHKLKSDAKPFECDTCGKRFIRKVELDHHAEIHWKRDLQKCKFCQKKYEVEHHLRSHESIHNWVNSLDVFEYDEFGVVWQSEPDDRSSGEFKEPIDADRSTNGISIKTTKNTKSSTNPHSSITDNPTKSRNRRKKSQTLVPKIRPKFDCFECKQRFESKQTLQRHELIHANKARFKCGYCYVTFNEINEKIAHEGNIHMQPRVSLDLLKIDMEMKDVLNTSNEKDEVKPTRPKRCIKITQKIKKPKVLKRKLTSKQISSQRSQSKVKKFKQFPQKGTIQLENDRISNIGNENIVVENVQINIENTSKANEVSAVHLKRLSMARSSSERSPMNKVEPDLIQINNVIEIPESMIDEIENKSTSNKLDSTKMKIIKDTLSSSSNKPSSQPKNNKLQSIEKNVCPDINRIEQRKLIRINGNSHHCRETRSWNKQFDQIERQTFKLKRNPAIKSLLNLVKK